MEELTIVVDDKVGTLADITYILGKSKINIESISAASIGGKAVLVLLVKDAAKAGSLLEKNGFKVLESKVLIVRLKDEPGQMAMMTGKLAKAGINILSLYYVAKEKGVALVAVHTDKPAKAKRLLAPLLKLEGE
ncbi:MAG: ACT domain-containing protein [Candidatus Micrarchaeota archaeon]|nr:ACT domain-containing protein [Candidatus Micrarchaeota archaeon]